MVINISNIFNKKFVLICFQQHNHTKTILITTKILKKMLHSEDTKPLHRREIKALDRITQTEYLEICIPMLNQSSNAAEGNSDYSSLSAIQILLLGEATKPNQVQPLTADHYRG